MRSWFFINEEDGFIKVLLPFEAQFASIYEFWVLDANDDGKEDLIPASALLTLKRRVKC